MDYPTILDKAFWSSPVCVFTGLTFAATGITVGVLIGIAI